MESGNKEQKAWAKHIRKLLKQAKEKDGNLEVFGADSHQYRLSEPVIYPEMSDEDWEKAADPEDEREEEELHPFAGILPIGTQGCTYTMGLMLHGPYRGQVVYFDVDCCNPPFFVREKGFLAWYERWLREVIAGYEISWFGMEAVWEQADPRDRLSVIFCASLICLERIIEAHGSCSWMIKNGRIGNSSMAFCESKTEKWFY